MTAQSSHWRPSTLGAEIELAYGSALPAHKRLPGNIPVYGSNGVVGYHEVATVAPPGIIVGRKGSVGEIAFSTQPFWPIDTTYYVVRRKENDWRFLCYLLRHLELTKLNSHSAVPGLNREEAYSIAVEIPDIHEQHSIARTLYFVTSALEREGTALNNAQALKHAAMRNLFTRGLRLEPQRESEIGPIPASWKSTTVGRHFAVGSGGTPSRSNPDYWRAGTLPWVKTTEVNYSVIKRTEEHITELGLRRSAAKMLPPGTLLLAMYGQGVTRGKVAMLGIAAACNQACATMTPLYDEIQPRYLLHFLTHRYREVRNLAHGGQQQNLNLDIVRALPIAFPNAEEQSEIVDILDAMDQKIDLHKRKEALLDELFKSLLNGLMTGAICVSDLDLTALDQVNTEQPQLIGVPS